ncbi:hypothetical protein HY485_00030, partial [Candidatus Woesearchaeota archaeon]|nr:hypothetical protein [Candidatus Woesearchaeota archaeon]
IQEEFRQRTRTIPQPTFTEEGYVVAPQNVPKPLPQKQRPEEAFINAVRAEVKEQYPNLTATQQEARADIVTRFKNLELD